MSEQALNAVFSALSSPVRRAMVAQLATGSACVTELQAMHDISLPAISKHLSVLERAGLVKRTTEGRFRHCELHKEPMGHAVDWIRDQARFWDASLDRLDRYLKDTKEGVTDDDDKPDPR